MITSFQALDGHRLPSSALVAHSRQLPPASPLAATSNRSTARYAGRVGVGKLESLTSALRKSWSADTSSSPDWTENNRAKGQCAVTACVVQDYFGGDILNTVATLPSSETVSHYFNVVDGETIDLTREQFPKGTKFTRPAAKPGRYSSTREYCLSYESTRLRYEKLRSRVTTVIGRSQAQTRLSSSVYGLRSATLSSISAEA
ncbi:YunG family protein [Nocardia amamiensis]|uniref:YunG family protein n=1 Tax=Nocardia amamiensis TaxID=404578 RepID=UPI003F812510